MYVSEAFDTIRLQHEANAYHTICHHLQHRTKQESPQKRSLSQFRPYGQINQTTSVVRTMYVQSSINHLSLAVELAQKRLDFAVILLGVFQGGVDIFQRSGLVGLGDGAGLVLASAIVLDFLAGLFDLAKAEGG